VTLRDGLEYVAAYVKRLGFFSASVEQGALTVNNMHDLEHYGNLATYMRMKSLAPPSSEQQQAPAQPAKK
jgi:hypothetical protein